MLSKELLSKLRVSKGDTLYATEAPRGIELTAYNPDFAHQMNMVLMALGYEQRNINWSAARGVSN